MRDIERLREAIANAIRLLDGDCPGAARDVLRAALANKSAGLDESEEQVRA